MFLEPTPAFYAHKEDGEGEKNENPRSFRFLFGYVKKYKRNFGQVVLGMIVGSLLQLVLPFLTQSIVDVGIKNQNLGFIWLILLGQLMLTFSRTAIDFYTIRYPITIEAQGKVTSNDSAELLVPYKYLYLFDEPRTVHITLEGQDEDAAPIVCSVTSHYDKLLIVDGNHYFTAKAFIHRYGSNAQPELKVSARIIVSDKTVWQQVFRK